MSEHFCIDIECTHYDGDMCILGFCEPDSPIYEKYLEWDKENFHKFKQMITFREWFDEYGVDTVNNLGA